MVTTKSKGQGLGLAVVKRLIEALKWVAAGEDVSEPVEYRWKVKSGENRWFSDSRKLVFSK